MPEHLVLKELTSATPCKTGRQKLCREALAASMSKVCKTVHHIYVTDGRELSEALIFDSEYVLITLIFTINKRKRACSCLTKTTMHDSYEKGWQR